VGQTALDGDGKELLLHALDHPDSLHCKANLDLIGQHVWAEVIAHALPAELLGQRAVVELSDDARAQRLRLEPGAQSLPHGRVPARHQQRAAVQALWERLSGAQCTGREHPDRRAAQSVAAGAHADCGRQWRVGNDQTQRVQRQFGQQAVEPPFAAHDPDRFLDRERRWHQVIGDGLGHRVSHPDAELQGSSLLWPLPPNWDA